MLACEKAYVLGLRDGNAGVEDVVAVCYETEGGGLKTGASTSA